LAMGKTTQEPWFYSRLEQYVFRFSI